MFDVFLEASSGNHKKAGTAKDLSGPQEVNR